MFLSSQRWHLARATSSYCSRICFANTYPYPFGISHDRLLCVLIDLLHWLRLLLKSALCLIETEKGDHCAGCNKKESGNPLRFFTEGVHVRCKDDELNAIFYTRRAASHFSIGEFTRLFALD